MTPLLELHCGDALPWLRSLPVNHVWLWITSPPYGDARTYGFSKDKIHRAMKWVDWYIPFCVEMARAGRLVALNLAGPVRKYRYVPLVEWLIADLTRNHGLVVGPSPYAWTKSAGTPGSGQDHYQRRDWEPVYVFGRPENFPPAWSNNTAWGAPPKYAPGGEFSNRNSAGKRVNQWGASMGSGTSRRRNGKKQSAGRPSHYVSTRRRQGSGERETMTYTPPKIANPGNVVRTVEPCPGCDPGLSDVIRTGNGGNQLGNKLAHKHEAPMNLAVAERFVRWFCPPRERVGDPMCGSGTSGEAAMKWNRSFSGCDNREVCIDQTRYRLARVRLAGE